METGTKLVLFPVKIPFYRENREDRDTSVPVTQCNELCIVTFIHRERDLITRERILIQRERDLMNRERDTQLGLEAAAIASCWAEKNSY